MAQNPAWRHRGPTGVAMCIHPAPRRRELAGKSGLGARVLVLPRYRASPLRGPLGGACVWIRGEGRWAAAPIVCDPTSYLPPAQYIGLPTAQICWGEGNRGDVRRSEGRRAMCAAEAGARSPTYPWPFFTGWWQAGSGVHLARSLPGSARRMPESPKLPMLFFWTIPSPLGPPPPYASRSGYRIRLCAHRRPGVPNPRHHSPRVGRRF